MQAAFKRIVRWGGVLIVLCGVAIVSIPSARRAVQSLFHDMPERMPEVSFTALPDADDESPTHAAVNYEEPMRLEPPPALISRAGLDNQSAAPPEFTKQSAFSGQEGEEPAPAKPLPLPPAGATDWKERVSAVRLQLERWGADYLLLETTGAGGYRFHCRMALPDGRATQPFEAIAADPAEAAEQVLDQIAEWRAAARRQ